MNDLFTYKNGQLKVINLSHLRRTQFKAAGRSASAVLTRPAGDQRGLADLLQPLFARRQTAALVPFRQMVLVKARSAEVLPRLVVPSRVPAGRKFPPFSIPLQRLPEKRYEVGDQQTEIPLGLPRFVNATTLKAMLGAKNSVLLRKTGDRWEVCPNSHEIDLEDATQVYRLNEITIYS